MIKTVIVLSFNNKGVWGQFGKLNLIITREFFIIVYITSHTNPCSPCSRGIKLREKKLTGPIKIKCVSLTSFALGRYGNN